VDLRSRWRRLAVAAVLALGGVTATVYFLIENVRAAGSVLIVIVVALASYGALGGRRRSRRDPSPLRVLMLSSGMALAVLVVGFALAVGLMVATRP
jgi:hypothetical protein